LLLGRLYDSVICVILFNGVYYPHCKVVCASFRSIYVFYRELLMFEAANSTHFYFTVEGFEASAKLQVLSFEGLEAISSDYAV